MARKRVNKKEQVITKLYQICKLQKNFIFDNNQVEKMCSDAGFVNKFDATKLDSSRTLPDVLKNDDVFVAHLGQGMHQFVRGASVVYHKFEPVQEENKYQWNYRPGMLDNINDSESNILSVGYNQRIIHDFLYRDITASPKVYGSHRTQIPLNYQIGSDKVEGKRVQIEIDFTAEYLGTITVFEAKKGKPDDFNVFQLFNPFRYYLQQMQESGQVKAVECCYLLHYKKSLRLYLYSFEESHNPGSIKLQRSAEYMLMER